MGKKTKNNDAGISRSSRSRFGILTAAAATATILLTALLLGAGSVPPADSLSTTTTISPASRRRRPATAAFAIAPEASSGGGSRRDDDDDDDGSSAAARGRGRRDVLLATGAALLSATARSGTAVAAETYYEGQPTVKTQSGLRYVDLEVGRKSGDRTPRYGQLCVISYTGYLDLPREGKRRKFASQTGFVLKHGNGKLIAGFDEGLHTMKRGGRRRLIIPPKLGFVAEGLGPLPELPWERAVLNWLLEQMVEQRGGNLVYDVTLERFFDDEADQGYYEDDEISPEEFAELNRRLNNGRGVGGGGNNVLDAVGNDIDLSERDREKPIV